MKTGLTFIHERTGQMRYADNAENVQWLQQLSTYIPIQEIKRGQPVSIATDEDLKIIADKNDDLYKALVDSSDSYIVLTNPTRHTNTIGLSLEYTEGQVSYDGTTLKTPEKIHILGQGQYIEDRDYYMNAFTISTNPIDVTDQEYWPEFFNDYKSYIGKKVYVKGSSNGLLTTVKEEAYLAHNNVIVVGFVTDALLKDVPNTMNIGAIEVQVQGDDRGIIDATTFEAIVGENVYIGKDRVQANGEENSYTKVFALGSEDDSNFKFSFNVKRPTNTDIPSGFIALQRWDGKTAYIYTKKKIDKDTLLTNEAYDYNDRAFWQVAQYYAANSTEAGDKIAHYEMELVDAADATEMTKLENFLKQAMGFISQGEDISLKDGRTTKITTLLVDSSLLSKNRFVCTADDIGGYFDVYVSSNITQFFSDLVVESHGSYFNKGYAVLADIRNPARQNIIGIYNSGHTGLVKKLENAIFMKHGLFTDSSAPYEVGVRYYLGSHGNIFKVPQEYYNSIISIGYAQTDSNLLVDCCDVRQYNNGDLPVGYMKPSIKGEAEFGFWLMDGNTPHKMSDGKTLYERLKNYYDESELKRKSYNFGSAVSPDYADGFIIPAVQFKRHTAVDGESYTPAQIKWLAEGVYKEMPRMPFIRRFVTVEGDDKHSTLPDIDITPLMIYGPDEDRIQVPDLESLNIKLFVDMSENPLGDRREWTQIDPGFHQSDNFTYFGYKWTVTRTHEPSADHPYGIWVLRAAYTGTEGAEDANTDKTALGLCYRADPYSPPMALFGRKARVYVTKVDYFSRQFDVEALFKDYVKETLVDASDTPWASNSVSGKAVRSDIYRRVKTKHLLFGEEDAATLEGFIGKIALRSTFESDENELAKYKITSQLRLVNSDPAANPNGPFLDWHNGLLKYFYQNETDESIKTANKISLKSKIYNDGYSLLPSFMFAEHRNLLVKNAPIGVDQDAHPHGIINDGWAGNLNAKTLQSAHLGYPQHILANNASEDASTSYNESTNATVRITVPYTQRMQTDNYLTRLGDQIKYYNGTMILGTDTLSYDNDKKLIKKQIDVPTGNNYEIDFFGSKDGNAKHIKAIVNFAAGGNDISFVDQNNDPLSLYGNFVSASSINKKYVLSRFESKNVPPIDVAASSKYKDVPETMNEALQAIFEMPLATFKYNREYESGKDYYKKYFGIIVERVAQTKETFKKPDEIKNSTAFDNVEYKYTDEEKKSIVDYLNIVTDNNEEGMRAATAIGILFKAAQETQSRLLNLEVSTYGKDSPTLPGADTLNPDLKNNDQHATIAGLNRLIKALCREVFQNADPTNIDEHGAWTPNGDNYSRLDMLDKEVNGEKAKDDNQTRIWLTNTLGTAYPKDASITETVTHDHKVISDAANDNDFGSADAVQYPDALAYTYTPETIENFDGLNDAVNRIVAKLDTLTTNVVGENDIKKRPQKLDYIRSSLETIIRELYSDTTEASDIESGEYVKKSLSRIDKILQNLYNYSLNYGTPTEYKKHRKEFNKKEIKGTINGAINGGNDWESIDSRSPEKIEDIFKQASLLDVIVQLISGDETNLVQNNASYDWKDLKKNDRGWKTKDGALSTTYNTSDYDEANSNERNKHTILERLDAIEKILFLYQARFTNTLDFTKLQHRTGEGAYKGISSIDDAFKYQSDNDGLIYDSDGVYSKNRKATIVAILNPGDPGYDKPTILCDEIEIDETTKIKTFKTYSRDNTAVLAERWEKAVHNSTKDLNAYDAIYDAIKRIKNSEWNLAHNNVALGSDFEDYHGTKETYEGLPETLPNATKDFTITSDLRAIIKLLYGADRDNKDGFGNQTDYGHFKTLDEKNDNFVTSPIAGGVSVLDKLYAMLFNVPSAYKFNGNITAEKITGATVDQVFAEAQGYNPLEVKEILAVPTAESVLGFHHRKDFINSLGKLGERKNRIDILENWVKAIYTYIGFGSQTNQGYYTGVLQLTNGNAAEPNSAVFGGHDGQGTSQTVIVNGLEGNGDNVINTFGKLAPQNTTYKISSFAIQGYYNSLDIQRLLGDGTIDGWVYTKPEPVKNTNLNRPEEFIHSVILGKNGANNKVFTVKEALDKLYEWTNKLDTSIINILATATESDRDVQDIYAWLGDYFTQNQRPDAAHKTVSQYIQDIYETIGRAVNTEAQRAKDAESAEAITRGTIDDKIIGCLGDDYKKAEQQNGKGTISERLTKIETFKGKISSGLKLNTDQSDKLKSSVSLNSSTEKDYLVTNEKLEYILNKVIEDENKILPEYSKIIAGYNKLLSFFKAQKITTDGNDKIEVTRTHATKEHNVVDVFALGNNNFSKSKAVYNYNGIEYCKLTFRDDTFGIQWEDIYIPKVGSILGTAENYSYITAKYTVEITYVIG